MMVKVRPIIFNSEMVKAILAGKKTQTRRIIKPQPRWEELTKRWLWWAGKHVLMSWGEGIHHPKMPLACKLGILGDRLWVRETWATDFEWDALAPRLIPQHAPVWWKASGQSSRRKNSVRDVIGKWRPSIFMPRWASRITLEVVKVRVERVQDITDKDADAEMFGGDIAHGPHCTGGECHCSDFYVRELFGQWWDFINAKPKPVKRRGAIVHYVSYPWDESGRDPRTEICGLPHYCYPNPWAWAVDFEVL